MSWKSDRDAYLRLAKAHQKWQMATYMLVARFRAMGIDMDWVIDSDKDEIVQELLRLNGARKLKDQGDEQ